MLFACAVFAGCYDAQEIDSDSYVIAIGADTAESGYVFTFQFSNPLSIYSDGGGGEGSSAGAVTLHAENFDTAKGLLGSFIGKNVNLSQTKVIIFSHDTAKAGVSNLVRDFLADGEIRENAYVLIASDSSEKFLEEVDPILSISAAKYYENLFRDEALKFAPLTALKTVGETLENPWLDCVVPLAGTAENEDFSGAAESVDFTAGEQPRRGGEKTEVIGMAVMKDGVLVGELSGYYAALFKILDKKAKNLPLSIDGAAFRITQNPYVSKSVSVKDGIPRISVNVSLTADSNNAERAQSALCAELENLLYRSAREYNADIFGFGNICRRKCLTDFDWERTNWSEIYKRAEFDVKVKISTK